MAEAHVWPLYTEIQAFLVALDISGFSQHMDESDQLLEHREHFLRAIAQTSLFAQAKTAGTVVTHFLGDELRLAFRGAVGAPAVRHFIDSVLEALATSNRGIAPARQTRVKGVVYNGVVIWKEWRGCPYLDGPLPFKAQRWMTLLQPGEIAADNGFKKAMTNANLPTGRLLERDFAGEKGYMLHTEGQ